MKYASGQEFLDDLRSRMEKRLPIYLPQDHHACITKIMSAVRLAEMSPDIAKNFIGEELPDNLLNTMADDAARNAAAAHMQSDIVGKPRQEKRFWRISKRVSFGIIYDKDRTQYSLIIATSVRTPQP
jgi:hypothetical protein